MLYLLKRSWWVFILLLGIQSGWAFSLLGPFPATTTDPDGYQQVIIGYNIGGDIGAPKNIGEEYRWNLPVVYYAFDDNFLNYFGSNGVTAVEKGVAFFNNLTNYSTYSPALNEFPLE